MYSISIKGYGEDKAFHFSKVHDFKDENDVKVAVARAVGDIPHSVPVELVLEDNQCRHFKIEVIMGGTISICNYLTGYLTAWVMRDKQDRTADVTGSAKQCTSEYNELASKYNELASKYNELATRPPLVIGPSVEVEKPRKLFFNSSKTVDNTPFWWYNVYNESDKIQTKQHHQTKETHYESQCKP